MYIFVYIHVYIYVYIYTYIHVYIYINTYVYIYVHMKTYNMYKYKYMHICTYIHTYIHVHTYIYTCTYIYTHICMYLLQSAFDAGKWAETRKGRPWSTSCLHSAMSIFFDLAFLGQMGGSSFPTRLCVPGVKRSCLRPKENGGPPPKLV